MHLVQEHVLYVAGGPAAQIDSAILPLSNPAFFNLVPNKRQPGGAVTTRTYPASVTAANRKTWRRRRGDCEIDLWRGAVEYWLPYRRQ